jgi:hypothetical protein
MSATDRDPATLAYSYFWAVVAHPWSLEAAQGFAIYSGIACEDYTIGSEHSNL